MTDKKLIFKKARDEHAGEMRFGDLVDAYEAELGSLAAKRRRGRLSTNEAFCMAKALRSFYERLLCYAGEREFELRDNESGGKTLEYRGQIGDVSYDDPGQQMVLRFRGVEYGTGAYNFLWDLEMCDIIDDVLFGDALAEIGACEEI